eukprot:superscaffoldBa00013055_g25878
MDSLINQLEPDHLYVTALQLTSEAADSAGSPGKQAVVRHFIPPHSPQTPSFLPGMQLQRQGGGASSSSSGPVERSFTAFSWMAHRYLRLSAGCRTMFRLLLPSNAPGRLVGGTHANRLTC